MEILKLLKRYGKLTPEKINNHLAEENPRTIDMTIIDMIHIGWVSPWVDEREGLVYYTTEMGVEALDRLKLSNYSDQRTREISKYFERREIFPSIKIEPSEVKVPQNIRDYVETRTKNILSEGARESYLARALFSSDILHLAQIKASKRGIQEVDKVSVENSIKKLNIKKYKPNLPRSKIKLSLDKPLTRRMAIIIPNKDNSGREFDSEFYNKLIEDARYFLADLNGGARIYDRVTGVWINPTSRKEFIEENKIVESKTDEIDDGKMDKFFDYLLGLKIKASQQSVMYEIDGNSYLL